MQREQTVGLKKEQDINKRTQIVELWNVRAAYLQLCEHEVIILMLKNSKQIGHRSKVSMF